MSAFRDMARAAIDDALWRKESLGVLFWALGHLDVMPPYNGSSRNRTSTPRHGYGSVYAFRAEGRLRSDDEIEAAWMEADAWFGATEGRDGEDAAVASTAAERFRALSWLRDADAAPA